MRVSRLLLILLGTALLTGCTFDGVRTVDTADGVRTLTNAAAFEVKNILVIGDITYDRDPDRAEWKAVWTREYRAAFEKAFREWVERNRGGEWAVTTDQTVKSPNMYRLAGKITRISDGIKGLRFWIGFGAGQAKVGGVFTVFDASGTPITSFDSRESYWGGFGIGGPFPEVFAPEFFDMVTLVRRFAETTAEAAITRIQPTRTAEK